jgi:head-tail adaptor
MLDAEDLAYMRETQALVRPTAAVLAVKASTRDGMGGTTDTWDWANPVPVQVRLHDPDDVPADLAEQYGSTELVKVTMDLVDVKAGDRLRARGFTYQIVSQGDPDEWTTAQVVWAVRA